MMGDGERSLEELVRRVRVCEAAARAQIEESKALLREAAEVRGRLRRVLEESAAFCEQARDYVGDARAAVQKSRERRADEDDDPPHRT
ncbi:MAG TPA: hypothetical protein VM261_19585 [Kofleriaceae bacterium]|nr:hypothetical protein [Kofleriaceae bacterium]